MLGRSLAHNGLVVAAQAAYVFGNREAPSPSYVGHGDAAAGGGAPKLQLSWRSMLGKSRNAIWHGKRHFWQGFPLHIWLRMVAGAGVRYGRAKSFVPVGLFGAVSLFIAPRLAGAAVFYTGRFLVWGA